MTNLGGRFRGWPKARHAWKVVIAWLCLGVVAVGWSATSAGEDPPECLTQLQPGESIQEAIDTADSGAVICLAPGVYSETLVITKPLVLRGTGAEAADVEIKGTSRSEPGITITNPEGNDEPFSVSFENITLSNRYPAKFHGIEILGTAGIILTNAQVLGSMRYGLILRDSATATITSSTIGDSTSGNLFSDASQVSIADSILVATTIKLKGSAIVEISSSDLSGTDSTVSSGCSLKAADSTLDRGYHLISGTAVFIDCSFSNGSSAPIVSNASAQLRMTGCIVSNNQMGMSYGSGIRIEGNSRAVIDDCEFSDNAGTPIMLFENASLNITNSRVLRNGGIGIGGYYVECADRIIPTGATSENLATEFAGSITGSGNTIPGPGEPDGNALGDVCPDSFRSVKE